MTVAPGLMEVVAAVLLQAAEPTAATRPGAEAAATWRERPNTVSLTLAPVFVAWHPGHSSAGGSDGLNIDPEMSVTSLGAKVDYGRRFARRFELDAGVEYARASLLSQPAIHLLRASVTPYMVLGKGRYDFSLGSRLGAGAFGYRGGFAPQVTVAASLRNRVWVHPMVGIVASLTSGVHMGVADGSGGQEETWTFEFVALRLGVAVRW